MALREEKYKPDIPVNDGINITNPHKKKTGIKFTETEILILSENGSVIGILDRKYFSTGKDDEGLLKDKPVPSMFDRNGKPVLVGNLLICRNNPETGIEVELTNEDAKLIMSHIVGVESPDDGKKWKGIHGVKF